MPRPAKPSPRRASVAGSGASCCPVETIEADQLAVAVFAAQFTVPSSACPHVPCDVQRPINPVGSKPVFETTPTRLNATESSHRLLEQLSGVEFCNETDVSVKVNPLSVTKPTVGKAGGRKSDAVAEAVPTKSTVALPLV
jgi:hypothetical protein